MRLLGDKISCEGVGTQLAIAARPCPGLDGPNQGRADSLTAQVGIDVPTLQVSNGVGQAAVGVGAFSYLSEAAEANRRPPGHKDGRVRPSEPCRHVCG